MTPMHDEFALHCSTLASNVLNLKHKAVSIFCHQDVSSNGLGRNEVNTKDKP